MKLLKALIPAWIVVAAYVAFCLWARTRLPDAPIVTHFDAGLHPDGWMARDQALFAPLAVYVLIMAALTGAPFVLPPRDALGRSAKAYGSVCTGVAALFAAILGSLVARALGWPIGIGETISVSMGLLFLVIGNFSTKVRPNFIYGVRTPWTLANEGVWDKTHRFAGPALMAGGLFIIVGGLLRPSAVVPILLVGALVPGLLAVVYSWWLWSKLPPDDKRRMRAGA